DKIDYAYWFQGAPLAGGLELAGVVAPEPATLALLTLGGLATLLRRKRLCHKAM
ncbi:MAG: PEP-CTERM sorting domain-containing protein, partial [Planctomycetes bacterium]|nr:PEP-CTERM sorting domain-containing protein [Planctomycetota bacterium]